MAMLLAPRMQGEGKMAMPTAPRVREEGKMAMPLAPRARGEAKASPLAPRVREEGKMALPLAPRERGEGAAKRRVRGSLTNHLRHDEESIAPRRRVARDGIPIERRPRLVRAHRCRIGFARFIEAGRVDFAQLVDVRENLRHLAGHAVEACVVELEMGEVGNAARFLAIDLHAARS